MLCKTSWGTSSQEASQGKAKLDEKEETSCCHPGEPRQACTACSSCWRSARYNHSLEHTSRHQGSCVVPLGVAAVYRGACQWGQVG